MSRRPQYRALAGIDRKALEAFQAGIRKRYTDEQILVELAACAKRLGKSPTMREFAGDPETSVHPQTVIEHFGSWNEAKRKAGLVPRRFATREELLELLRGLGEELGRIPTARDIEEHRGRMPSKSLYWHTFGSLANALREAGFDVPVGEERLERALEQGMELAHSLGRLPKFADWSEARKRDETMLTEWQIYRMFDGRKGAWSTFQFLVRERLVADRGGRRRATGVSARRRSRPAPRGAGGRTAPSCGARTAGSDDSSKSRSGLKRSFSSDLAVGGRPRACPRRPRACAASRPGTARPPRARPWWTRTAAPRGPSPIQSGRPTPRARNSVPERRSSSQAVAIEPRSCSRARGAPSCASASAKMASESTVISGSARSKPCCSISSSSLKMIPLWTPTTAPWRIGWLLASIRGWPFV